MSTQYANIPLGVSSPEWGSDTFYVYDITNLNIFCSKFISGVRPTDKYNERGQNITAQERRQVLLPWIMSNPTSKRFNHRLPQDTYDQFQFKHGNHHVWSDGYKVYSTTPSIC